VTRVAARSPMSGASLPAMSVRASLAASFAAGVAV